MSKISKNKHAYSRILIIMTFVFLEPDWDKLLQIVHSIQSYI